MSGALRGVDDTNHAKLAGAGTNVRDGIHHSHRVRNVREREELHPAGELLIDSTEIKCAFVASDGKVGKLRTSAFGDHLPRHEVAVMLQLREQDLVAGLEMSERPGV